MDAAHAAYKVWRDVPGPKRGEVLRLIREELAKSKEALGALVSLEMGKVSAFARFFFLWAEVMDVLEILQIDIGLCCLPPVAQQTDPTGGHWRDSGGYRHLRLCYRPLQDDKRQSTP